MRVESLSSLLVEAEGKEALAASIKAERIAGGAEAELHKSMSCLSAIMGDHQIDGPNMSHSNGGRAGKKSPGYPTSENRAVGGRGLRGFAMSVCNKIEQVSHDAHTWRMRSDRYFLLYWHPLLVITILFDHYWSLFTPLTLTQCFYSP